MIPASSAQFLTDFCSCTGFNRVLFIAELVGQTLKRNSNKPDLVFPIIDRLIRRAGGKDNLRTILHTEPKATPALSGPYVGHEIIAKVHADCNKLNSESWTFRSPSLASLAGTLGDVMAKLSKKDTEAAKNRLASLLEVLYKQISKLNLLKLVNKVKFDFSKDIEAITAKAPKPADPEIKKTCENIFNKFLSQKLEPESIQAGQDLGDYKSMYTRINIDETPYILAVYSHNENPNDYHIRIFEDDICIGHFSNSVSKTAADKRLNNYFEHIVDVFADYFTGFNPD